MSTEKLQDIKLDVELLKKDVEQFDTLCDRITQSIEKIQDVNQNLIKMISLHEQRHDQHEKSEEDIEDEEDIKALIDLYEYIAIEPNDKEVLEAIDILEDKLYIDEEEKLNTFDSDSDSDSD